MKEKIYTPAQVLIATALGGPAGCVYTLSKNSEGLENANKIMLVVVMGGLLALLYVLLFPFLPVVLSLGVLPPAYCAAAYIIAKRSNIKKQLTRIGKPSVDHTAVNVAIVSASALAGTLLAEYIWINLLPASAIP
jgi:hypothetical protein